MKNKIIMGAIYAFAVLLFAAASLYIGKTTINGGHITVERPITAALFFLAFIAALFNI